MSKITLTDLVNLQNETTAVNAINSNSDVITAAFDNTLSRDGTTPNTMSANLDMNSNRILNLLAPSATTEPVRLQDFNTFIAAHTTNVTNGLPTGGTTGQAMVKNSGVNFDAGWASLVPTGGTSGQILVKNTSTNFDASWQAPSTIPSSLIAVPGLIPGGATDNSTVFTTADGSFTDLFVPAGTYAIANNIVLGSHYRFAKGAILKVASGKTVTFNSFVEAGPWQIFDTSPGGTIVYGTTCQTYICYPEWWGALPSTTAGASNDCTAAITSAIRFMETRGGTVMFAPLVYKCTSVIQINNSVQLKGSNEFTLTVSTTGTSLDFSTSSTASTAVQINAASNSALLAGVVINDIAIVRTLVASGTGCIGLALYGAVVCTYNRIAIKGFDTNLYVGACLANASITNRFTDCLFFDYGTLNHHLVDQTTTSFINCEVKGYNATPAVIQIEAGVHASDTTLYEYCRIGNIQYPVALVLIYGGFYHTFRNCDLETATSYGISTRNTVDYDQSINVLQVEGCWFSDVGTPISQLGFLNSILINNNPRIHLTTTGTSAIFCDDSRGTQQTKRVKIVGNNIISAISGAPCVSLFHCKGALVNSNTMQMIGAAAAQTAITLGATTASNIVVGNSLNTSFATGISDSGSGNTVANNLQFT